MYRYRSIVFYLPSWHIRTRNYLLWGASEPAGFQLNLGFWKEEQKRRGEEELGFG